MSLWQTPVILLAFLMWLQSPPANLADAARREALRRQLLPQATRSLSNADVERVPSRPLPTPPSEAEISPAAPAAAEPAAASDTHDEAWWRTRVTQARVTLERDQLLVEALQSRINGLTADWSARDDPAQRQAIWEQRERAIGELARMKDQVTADAKAIEAIEDEARRQNVPAEWVR